MESERGAVNNNTGTADIMGTVWDNLGHIDFFFFFFTYGEWRVFVQHSRVPMWFLFKFFIKYHYYILSVENLPFLWQETFTVEVQKWSNEYIGNLSHVSVVLDFGFSLFLNFASPRAIPRRSLLVHEVQTGERSKACARGRKISDMGEISVLLP